jgi:hypothetical protein
VQTIIEDIRKIVQWHKLGNTVPVLRIEKLAGKRTRYQKFWLFLAIESLNVGEIPEKVQSTLFHIPALSWPEKEPFTYEQIRTMVGPEQEVHNYARSIPYLFHGPQILVHEDPFDQSDMMLVQNDQEENMLERIKRYDQLMLWLSAIGSGSWHMFRSACQALDLDHDGFQPGRILRNLRLLGHIESSRSGTSWIVAPPVLVLQNSAADEEEREYFFCGARDNMLLQALHSIAKVQTLPHRDGGNAPAALHVWARESIEVISYLTGIPSTLQLSITNNASHEFARLLPPIADWMHSLEVLDGVMPYMFDVKKFSGNAFIDDTFQGKSGFYQLWLPEQPTTLKKPQYTLFYNAESHQWLRGDWYGLRFLSRQLDNIPCPVRYEAESRSLAVPKEWRWPELYERALVLASGMLPSQRGSWLVYDNIGPEVVHELSVKLNLEEETSHA